MAAVVESVKAAFDIYAPVSGKITDVNKALESNPGLINQSPYTDGWIFELEFSNPAELNALMTAAQYQEVVRQTPKH
jgi:glycine cleavage system H protein